MSKFNKYTFLFLALGIIVTAAIIENSLLGKHPEKSLIADLQQQIIQNQKAMRGEMQQLAQEIKSEVSDDDYSVFFDRHTQMVKESGTGYLIFKDSELKFWSDRSIAFSIDSEEIDSTKNFLQLPNGYYLVDRLQVDSFEIYGLHLVKYNYAFENKYLKNNFYESYDIPDDYIIDVTNNEKAYRLKNADGAFIFSLWPYGKYLCTTSQLYVPGFIYLLGLVFLLLYFRREFVERQAPFTMKLVGLGTALFIVYWFHLIFQVPKVFFHLRFFGPDFFAINYWLPSLGDYFLLALFFLFWAYNFTVDLNLDELENNSNLPRKTIVVILYLFSALTFVVVHYLIRELIHNSTISFALNKIIGITFQSVLGVFSIGLLLLGIILLSIKITLIARDELKMSRVLLVAFAAALFMAGVQYLSIGNAYLSVLVLFVVCVMLASVFSKKYLETFTLSYLIVFVAAVSLYSLLVINASIREKERDQQKVLAVTLVTERDPAAEVFLAELQFNINNDGAIKSLLAQGEDVGEYIRKSYFNTYFRKYLLNIYVCDKEDSLLTGPNDVAVPCRPFMNDKIGSQGVRIPGTNFFFMDNMNGRISYTGRLHYKLGENGPDIDIYIDLDSDLLFEGIGFPELLIDKSMARSETYRKFNYAKYYAGELTDKFGDYNYNFNGHEYLKDSDKEFNTIRRGKYEHLVYHTYENNFVVVSRKQLSFVDYLIAFPYLFVFFFLMLMIILIVGNNTLRERKFVFDLKFRIQAAIISIVFISLLVVALVTIFYNVGGYKNKHRSDLNEKMKSISEEIDMRLTTTEEISEDQVIWLHRELAKLSNIFRTDINIYATDGSLMASSRGEIFDRGLVSTKINAKAYNEVFNNFKISYFQPEEIGGLSYLSAYRPIINDWGDHLGVINLPYFIKQDYYSQEISTFIVAFINLYVLLFLASIIAAVFIANQITRPLVVIQQNLQKMQLGKRNEPILYNRQDEIGSLVKEYNKKVEELEISAELLARSERESAWREMAKQIAHEIKNPLTPMKLNIQYLQRFKGKDEDYNRHLDRVTGTLIEQIDNLSKIATEFSNFAKMPTAKNEIFDLAGALQRLVDLYETHDKAQIEFVNNCSEMQEVNADKEQLSRAIINLIRNGIQSIPENREGQIRLELTHLDGKAQIAVRDNGSGIPVELRHKLFTPSFTTKNSGMGLGLAIVKSIVENFSGKIWFETEIDEGTVFYVEVPVIKNNDE